MNKIIKYSIAFFLAMSCVISFSCKTTRHINTNKVMPMFVMKLYNEVCDNYLNYNSLHCKFSANVKLRDKEHSFSGSLKIKRDSVILISITPALGIEVARIQLTCDSIKFIDKINKEYYCGTYKYVGETYDADIDFDIIQSIFSNEIFTYPNSEKIEDPRHTFKSTSDSNFYVLQSKKMRKLKKNFRKGKTSEVIFQYIYIASEIFKVHQIVMDEMDDERVFDLSYSNFIVIGEKVFPEHISLKMGKIAEPVLFDLTYDKVMINTTSNFSFSVPEKYERITYN